MKKISLIKKDNKVAIKFEVEVFFKKHIIEIELVNKNQNLELIEKELKELKEENIELKKIIEEHDKEIKEIIKILNSNFI